MGLSVVKRPYLVAAAAALLIVMAAAVFVTGDSWLDKFKRHSLMAVIFVALPAIGAALCLALACLPRVLQINVLVFAGLWLMVECTIAVVNWNAAPPEIEQREAVGGAEYVTSDPALGNRPLPNTTARHTASHRDQVEFVATYTFDVFGRRRTPSASPRTYSNFLLFFGDSNMLGEGLGETQTLPYYVGQFAPGYQPYNYAFSGWGPAQMLELLKSREIPTQIAQRRGIALFDFIPEHIGRVVGSSAVSTGWGSNFPYYALDHGDVLVRHGDFVHQRRFLTLFYYLVSLSPAVQYFGLELPLHYSDYDYRLTARILAESQQQLKEQLDVQEFVVIIGPSNYPLNETDSRAFLSLLKEAGVKYLDYSQLFSLNDVKNRVSLWNYHNSALANRVIAQHLVNDLGIGRSP